MESIQVKGMTIGPQLDFGIRLSRMFRMSQYLTVLKDSIMTGQILSRPNLSRIKYRLQAVRSTSGAVRILPVTVLCIGALRRLVINLICRLM